MTEVAQPSKAAYLVLITPETPGDEVAIWGLQAHRQANIQQAIFRIMSPGTDGSPSRQPEIVKKAVADGASALIVVPGDSAELAVALADAESKGVPVVLIGRSIPAPPGAKPFTIVEHGGFEESARRIVETTLGDAGKVGHSTDGAALIMVNPKTDTTSSRRVAALKAAAEAKGFRKVVLVPFEPINDDSARLAVFEAVKQYPDVAIVLTDDSESMNGASQARNQAGGKPAFFVGGYIDFGPSKFYLPPRRESCFVEGRFANLGALAAKTALAKAGGEAIEGPVILASTFTRGEGLAATEADRDSTPLMREGVRIPGDAKTTDDRSTPVSKP